MSQLSLIERVQKQMNEDAQAGRINPIELEGMLFALSEAKNEKEVGVAIRLFADKFVSFQTVLDDEFTDESEAIEVDVQALVSRIIVKDPKLADKVTQFAIDKHLSVEEIKLEFPEIVNYLD
jgi:hypothetical protein